MERFINVLGRACLMGSHKRKFLWRAAIGGLNFQSIFAGIMFGSRSEQPITAPQSPALRKTSPM